MNSLTSGALRVSQPDLVIGKQGLELRGIFWVEGAQETSYFVLRLNSANETLTLELDADKLSSILLGAIENALALAPRLHDVPGVAGSTQLRAEWALSGFDVSEVRSSIGKAFGDEWQSAMDQLVKSKTTAKKERKSQVCCGGVPWMRDRRGSLL